MAFLSLTDAYINLNSGTLVSSYGNKVELDISYDKLDTTTFGQTAHTYIAGLATNSLTLTFNQDFASSALDSIIWAIRGTVVNFEIRPTSGTVSSSNPKYTGSILIAEYNPIGGGVGDLAQVSVTWPVSGVVTRGTS